MLHSTENNFLKVQKFSLRSSSQQVTVISSSKLPPEAYTAISFTVVIILPDPTQNVFPYIGSAEMLLSLCSHLGDKRQTVFTVELQKAATKRHISQIYLM